MEIFELDFNTRVATGATHAVRITHEDLTETTANTAQVLQVAVADGEVFEYKGTILEIPFEDSSDAAFNTNVLIVGLTGGDTDLFQASQELNANGTTIDYATGAVAQGPSGYAFNTADTVDFNIAAMAAKSLSDIDTGSLLGLFRKVDLKRIKPNN